MEENKDSENSYSAEKLEWIQTCEKINAIGKSEGLREKMTDKIKQNPFVPIGMLATTVALSVGVYSMRTGNKRRQQLMMRARVGAQGFTVMAILLGVMVANKVKPTNVEPK